MHPCFFVKCPNDQGKVVAHITLNLCQLVAAFFVDGGAAPPHQFVLGHRDAFFRWEAFVDAQDLPENAVSSAH